MQKYLSINTLFIIKNYFHCRNGAKPENIHIIAQKI